jgi:hypothetical protein
VKSYVRFLKLHLAYVIMNVTVKKEKNNETRLYANIHAKRKRIKEGSKEKMRKVGSKGAPTAKQFKQAAKTAKKKK